MNDAQKAEHMSAVMAKAGKDTGSEIALGVLVDHTGRLMISHVAKAGERSTERGDLECLLVLLSATKTALARVDDEAAVGVLCDHDILTAEVYVRREMERIKREESRHDS